MKNNFIIPSLILSYILFMLLLTCEAKQDASIKPGAYVFEEYFPLITGKRIGIVVNHASVIGHSNLVDTLLNLSLDIEKIYTPEHGFKGNAEAGASVNDDTYSEKEIPVISLYGSKRKPTDNDLASIDIMVFDLQDVGVRFYTYISSLHYIMEACAQNEIPLIVLDRPNPNGHYVDGPVLNEKFSSFVGMHTVPIVYGMTIGEYARMINGEFWLSDSVQCELVVIRCKNYSHTDYYSLPIDPSPNLKNMSAIYLYPSTCLFEGTVISEGRGTEAPFQLIGHPDYSRRDVSFIPKSIPGASMNPKLEGKICYGIDLQSLSSDSLKKLNTIQLEYILDFYNDLNLGSSFFIDYFELLAGTDTLRKKIVRGWGADKIRKSWQEELVNFKEIRGKYLLYPDFDE